MDIFQLIFVTFISLQNELPFHYIQPTDEKISMFGERSRHDTKPGSPQQKINLGGACKYCSRVFKSLQGLKHHIKEQEGKFKYKCSYCGKGYNIKSGYDYHVSKHEGKGFSCLKCKTVFRIESKFKTHVCSSTYR